MTGGTRPSSAYLLARSLVPSVTSTVFCFCFGFIVVGMHLLLLSLATGASPSGLFDGQWELFYTQYVVSPAEQLLNNNVANTILTGLLWGFVGFCVYILGEYFFWLISDWWHAEHDIELVRNGRVVRHPGRLRFIGDLFWQIGVLGFGVAALIAMQHPIRHALDVIPHIYQGTLPTINLVTELLVAAAIWALLAHCLVVFVRLLLRRTRLFGDAEIE